MSEAKNINPIETLHSFMHRKTVQELDMAQEAQRLVNLFRHLNIFGDDYIEPFNQQLLSAPKEVILLLPTIVGGSLVRQYYDHLRRQMGLTTENADEVSLPQGEDGYLPGPEDDLPLVTAAGVGTPVAAGAGVSAGDMMGVVNKIIETQGQLFTDTLEKITVETRDNVSRQTAELAKVLAGTSRGAYTVVEDNSSVEPDDKSDVDEKTFADAGDDSFDVDDVAAELMQEDESDEEITTVIPEAQPRAFKPQPESDFEDDDDIEILSEIDLSND